MELIFSIRFGIFCKQCKSMGIIRILKEKRKTTPRLLDLGVVLAVVDPKEFSSRCANSPRCASRFPLPMVAPSGALPFCHLASSAAPRGCLLRQPLVSSRGVAVAGGASAADPRTVCCQSRRRCRLAPLELVSNLCDIQIGKPPDRAAFLFLVDPKGFEPSTSRMRTERSGEGHGYTASKNYKLAGVNPLQLQQSTPPLLQS